MKKYTKPMGTTAINVRFGFIFAATNAFAAMINIIVHIIDHTVAISYVIIITPIYLI